jgi:hypothetical protein
MLRRVSFACIYVLFAYAETVFARLPQRPACLGDVSAMSTALNGALVGQRGVKEMTGISQRVTLLRNRWIAFGRSYTDRYPACDNSLKS